MTEARLKGILSPDAFADETRPDIVESPQLTPEQFAVNEVRSLMNAHYCYEPPIWYGQPYHVIVICEKLAQFPMLKRLLKDWQVEILILRGDTPYTVIYEGIDHLHHEITIKDEFLG